jgi:hypothetical protein
MKIPIKAAKRFLGLCTDNPFIAGYMSGLGMPSLDIGEGEIDCKYSDAADFFRAIADSFDTNLDETGVEK